MVDRKEMKRLNFDPVITFAVLILLLVFILYLSHFLKPIFYRFDCDENLIISWDNTALKNRKVLLSNVRYSKVGKIKQHEIGLKRDDFSIIINIGTKSKVLIPNDIIKTANILYLYTIDYSNLGEAQFYRLLTFKKPTVNKNLFTDELALIPDTSLDLTTDFVPDLHEDSSGIVSPADGHNETGEKDPGGKRKRAKKNILRRRRKKNSLI